MITVADTCRPGDPDPEPAGDERPRCTSRSHGFGCTRVTHASGQHEAGGGTVVHATWDYEGGNFRDETGPRYIGAHDERGGG